MTVRAKLHVYVRARASEIYRGQPVAIQKTALTREYYECYGGFCRRMCLVWEKGKWFYDEAPYDGSARCRRNGRHPHRWTPPSRRRRRR